MPLFVKKSLLKKLAVLLIYPCLMLSVQAQTEREHDAHEHGTGNLNIALDGKDVAIELTAPGFDIVGFEHAARSEGEKMAVNMAVKILKQGNNLFAFSANAGCELKDVQAELHDEQEEKQALDLNKPHKYDAKTRGSFGEYMDNKDKTSKNDHDHDDDHEKKHAHEHKDSKHDHSHDHTGEKHAQEENHTKFEARYHFTCTHPEKLLKVKTDYFNNFKTARKLVVQWVSSQGQGQTILTPEKSDLSF